MCIEWRSLKEFDPFYAIKFLKLGKNAWALMAAPKNGAKTVEL